MQAIPLCIAKVVGAIVPVVAIQRSEYAPGNGITLVAGAGVSVVANQRITRVAARHNRDIVAKPEGITKVVRTIVPVVAIQRSKYAPGNEITLVAGAGVSVVANQRITRVAARHNGCVIA
jgi:hypothetical protein